MQPSTAPESAASPDAFALTEQRTFSAPLTIGVISDTHIYAGSRRRLPDEVCDLFRRFRCGLIVHAGDANSLRVLQALAEIAPVLAVVGNNDDAGYRAVVPEWLTFTVGRFRFAVLHGHGGRSARAEAARRFAGRADLVIYGHSHIPMSERQGDSVLFNPGSATDRRWHEHFGVGLIHVDAERVLPELVLYQNPRDLANVNPD